ncbi:MAG: UbiX family flavin prenyltransferase [Acidobacteria bacterium]|nr:UbiX family flavin prenyltransferase [Acidobacteriota bacterium]
MPGKTIVVGISGGSGGVYAQRLLGLLEADTRVARVHLVVSSGGLRILRDELGLACRDTAQLPEALLGRAAQKIESIPIGNIGAAIASGSYPTDGMVIIPCSMGTLGAIASGVTDNLMRRAADVHLKEGRLLLLCWRDTPLNTIHLENALRVARAGAINFPISPGYYFGADKLDDLVTQFCCRVLARLGLPQEEQFEWKGTKG